MFFRPIVAGSGDRRQGSLVASGHSGELMSQVSWSFRTATLLALPVIVSLLLSRPAYADFFDDAGRTFQTDIPHFFTQDFPHFFQDDIPCAFGGHPTSGAKTSCASSRPSDGKNASPKEPVQKNDTSEDSSSIGEH
jgi:hypothetical protein